MARRNLSHVTLATGHVSDSPRHEVSAGILERLRPIVAAGTGALGYEDWYLRTLHEERHGDRRSGVSWQIESQGDPDRPFVLCMTCWSTASSPALWDRIEELQAKLLEIPGFPNARPRRPSVPWLAVAFAPALMLLPVTEVHALGDAERCIAWAQIEAFS